MSHLPAAYHDAQYSGSENLESEAIASQEKNDLLDLSRWDFSDWSFLDDSLYEICPLELKSESNLNSIGKLLKR
jgi:hypothetical protein